jgi:hypothetical protein
MDTRVFDLGLSLIGQLNMVIIASLPPASKKRLSLDPSPAREERREALPFDGGERSGGTGWERVESPYSFSGSIATPSSQLSLVTALGTRPS